MNKSEFIDKIHEASEEVWRPVTEFKEYLEVSNFGRVKVLERVVKTTHPRTGKPMRYVRPERITSGTYITGGYKGLTIVINGEPVPLRIHRLVASAFIENPKNRPFVNHIDNLRDNNHYKNLEWCTQKENIQHMIRQKRNLVGEDHPNSKFTNEMVRTIRFIFENGHMSQLEIAKHLDVEDSTIWKICSYKLWTHI